jgi:hypothetical protein
MNKTESVISPDAFSKMQTGDPVAIYKKEILGKVEVSVINPFNGTPEPLILEGDPQKNDPRCFVEVWSQMAEVFFERQNKPLFKQGYIVKMKDTVKPEEKEDLAKSYEHFTREHIEELVTAPYMKFRKELNEIDSEPILFRVLTVAEELERPEKTMINIRQRLTEVQQKE